MARRVSAEEILRHARQCEHITESRKRLAEKGTPKGQPEDFSGGEPEKSEVEQPIEKKPA